MSISHHFIGLIGVLIWFASFSSLLYGPILWAYVLICTQFWPISVLYALWIIYDRKAGTNGGKTPDLTHFGVIAKMVRSYFSAKIIKTAELDPSRNYLICCHPHGAFGIGGHTNFAYGGNGTDILFPGISMRFLTLDIYFYLPIFRDICLFIHSCSCSRESMKILLSRKGGGNGVVLMPGGTREMLYAGPGNNTLYLKNRKGFVKVAIENGSPLVPVYTFGENDLYSQVLANPKGSWVRALQNKCIDLTGLMPLLVWGNFFLPRRVPIFSVVGKPIFVEKILQPSDEYVDEIHGIYLRSLEELYNTYRDKYGQPDLRITIE